MSAKTTLTLVAAAGANFGGQPFQGCSRGAATQDPWISGAPAAQLEQAALVELMQLLHQLPLPSRAGDLVDRLRLQLHR